MKKVFLKNVRLGVWEFALFALLVLHFFANLSWILINNAPTLWDPSNHTYISLLIADRLKDFDPIGILYTSNYYPIFIHFLAALPLVIFGQSIKIAQFTGTVFFIITLSIIYIYLKHITKNPKIAFFSTCLFSLFPVIYDQSRLLMLDIPSVGIFFLTLLFLDKSGYLKDTKYSLLAAFTTGLLAMTKWTPLFFLGIPFLVTLVLFFKSNQKTKIIKNAILGAVIFAVTILPWYGANFNDILFLTQVYGEGDPKAHPQIFWSAENFLTYYKIFLYTQATPLPALTFIVSLFVYPFLKIPKTSIQNTKWFILGMIGANYLFFTRIMNKDGRFTIHLLPLACLIIFWCLEDLIKKNRLFGYLVYVCLIGFSLFYFGLMTVRPANWEGVKFSANLPVFGGLEFINVDDSLAKRHDARDWNMNELLADLKALRTKDETRILVVSEWAHFNPSNIRTYSKLAGLGDIMPVTPDLPYLRKNYRSEHFPNDLELIDFVSKNDFLLASPDNIGSPYLLNMIAMRQIQSLAFPMNFPVCNNFRLKIANAGSDCYLKSGEVLSSTSDIVVDGSPLPVGAKIVSGFAKVNCPFGCSFEFMEKTPGENSPKPIFDLIKIYTLPNGQQIHLFKINPSQNNSDLIN